MWLRIIIIIINTITVSVTIGVIGVTPAMPHRVRMTQQRPRRLQIAFAARRTAAREAA